MHRLVGISIPSPMHDRSTWSNRLLAVAQQSLGSAPAHPQPGNFVDDMGNRLPIDEPFFATLANRAPLLDTHRSLGTDEHLWLHAGGFGHLAPPLAKLLGPMPTTAHPLLTQNPGQEMAIEVYTERLLCALHALWRLGRVTGNPEYPRRCAQSCAWIVENLQPDNATNYPWGVHVMLATSPRVGQDATLYAETLLHNCQVTLGRADRRSAWILLDAGQELALPDSQQGQ